MNNLCTQLNLFCLNGNGMNIPLEKAMASLDYDDSLVKRRGENLEKIFHGERPTVLPILSDLRWWFAEQYNDGTLNDSLRDVDLAKIMATTWSNKSSKPTIPPVPLNGVTTREEWSGSPVVYKNGGFPGTEHAVIIETKYGVLRAVESYASRSFGIVEHPVKTVDDLRIVRHIYELRAEQISHMPIDGTLAEKISVGPTPLQNLLIHLAGVECGVMLLSDEEEEVESFMEFMTDLERPCVEKVAACRGSFGCENLSSDISGSYWDKYLGPQLKSRSDICTKAGTGYGIHQDGMLSPLLGRLSEAGIAYVNGVTAAPSGDVEPEELRALAGPDIILADIVPQAIFMDNFSEAAFEQYINRVVQCFKNDGKIVLGIGDMLPSVGSIKRVERYFDIVESACK